MIEWLRCGHLISLNSKAHSMTIITRQTFVTIMFLVTETYSKGRCHLIRSQVVACFVTNATR